MKRTTNPALKQLIDDLQRAGQRQLARRLAAPARRRSAVSVWKIERAAARGETVIVPGTVLSDGELTKPVTVYALKFTRASKEKIVKAGGAAQPLTAESKGRILV